MWTWSLILSDIEKIITQLYTPPPPPAKWSVLASFNSLFWFLWSTSLWFWLSLTAFVSLVFIWSSQITEQNKEENECCCGSSLMELLSASSSTTATLRGENMSVLSSQLVALSPNWPKAFFDLRFKEPSSVGSLNPTQPCGDISENAHSFVRSSPTVHWRGQNRKHSHIGSDGM